MWFDVEFGVKKKGIRCPCHLYLKTEIKFGGITICTVQHYSTLFNSSVTIQVETSHLDCGLRIEL